jgi:hypothetical protein
MADGERRPEADADSGKPADTEKGEEKKEKGEDKPAPGPKEGEAREDGPHRNAGRGTRKDPGGQEHLGSQVYQNFYGDVHAPGSSFGNRNGADGAGDQHGRGRAEGPLEESVIAGIVRAYARPACYPEAAQALAANRVVVITGESGTGRRAGAIAMLADIRLPDKPLVRINPSATLEMLAAREFSVGAAYLIIDKFAEPIAPEMAEYHWEEVCRKIRKAKAHLVVTTGTGSMAVLHDVISQFPWQRPDALAALRAHLGAALVADDVLATVSEALGADYALADVGRIARRITAGDDVTALVDEIQGSGQRTVEEWLRKVDAAIPAVVEVATLAFVLGVTERAFEDEVSGLKPRLAEFAPDLDTDSKQAKAEIDLRFRQLRKLRADHPLLTVRQVPVAETSGSIAVRHVFFRAPEYRRQVIAGLWNSLDREFWSGIHQWLHRIAAGDDHPAGRHAELMNSAAVGLSLLGLVAPDEIIDSYLNPWTSEDASLSEQTMAVYVVWRMSMLERLAPLALRIAILWAGQGPKNQRRLAAYAFSGELGARYPVEATKRLGQLADQGELLVGVAFAQLFTTLAEQGGDAVVVLRELRHRLFSKKDRPSAGLVVSTVAELLSVRDFRSGRPAVAVFLLGSPEHAPIVGLLWARALYLRPWRDRAIAALLATVQTVAHRTLGSNPRRLSELDAEQLARSLGAAIGQALPPTERMLLREETMRRVEKEHLRKERERKSWDGTADPASPADADFLQETYLDLLRVLLNAIVNPSPRELER